MPDETTETVSPLPSGTRTIGSFRIVRKLGEGGMGIVYEAEQQHPRRAVALKVIRGGAFVDEMHVKLFQREAQTLARLKHPSIAAIYEMGRTDDGQHFFAMELVRGETLGDWWKRTAGGTSTSQGSSPIPDRRTLMGLFRKICDAVAYAHQRGVIHRDLKPSNILVVKEASSVTSEAGLGVPDIKILDFGLARMTNADVATSTMVTDVGTVRGTLPYMSPEQVRGNPDEIDLRTDVYSLGVILYELVTGRLPYDVSRAGLPEAVRIICDEPPVPLTKASSATKKIDSDVATIVLKALEKEPARRYQSIAALADDVQRYLSDQPIMARPPSAAYQLRKLVARHKVVFGFVAALFVVLTAFAASMSVQAHRIALERDRANAEKERANREAATSQQVSDFLVNLFHVADPSEARGSTITAREILDKGAEEIQRTLKDQPAVQARLLQAMGQVYHGLGLYGRGIELLRTARGVAEKTFGPESLEEAEILDALVIPLAEHGQHDEALSAATRAVAIKKKRLPTGDVDLARSLYRLGDALFMSAPARSSEGAALIEEARRIFEARLGPQAIEVAWCWNDLGIQSFRDGDLTAARERFQRALAIKERVLPPDHPDLSTTLGCLGYVILKQGAFEEARPYLERSAALAGRAFGEQHPQYGQSLQSLGELWWRSGHAAQALPYLQRALPILENGLQPGSSDLAPINMTLGGALRDLGRYREAEPYLRKALDLAGSGTGLTPVTVAEASSEYAKLLGLTGREAEARVLEERARRARTQPAAIDHSASPRQPGL